MSTDDKIEELRRKRDECAKECETLSKELASLEEFARKQSIQGVTLDTSKKLIDLLSSRILDPSPEWKSRIDTLINIPTSEKGDVLRGGDYFEAFFQLAIAIGVLPQFQNAKVVFHDVVKYKDVRPFENYLYTKPIKNSGGGEQGISDITFELMSLDGTLYTESIVKCGELPAPTKEVSNPFYFISVKGYKREKSIAKEYDLPLLGEQLKEFPEIKNKHIVVCVRNKDQFLKRLGRSRMEFLKNSIDHVIGYDDVIQAFSTFRTNFFLKLTEVTPQEIKKEITNMFPEKETYKPSLSMYFHQELVVKSTLQRIASNPTPSKPYFLCVGVLPRGGKSYIAGGIIDMHRKMKARDTYNVLFLTSAVNETREQFKEDLIEKFSEFKDFQFIDVVNTGKKKVTLKKNNFIFVSRQLSSLSKESEGKETSVVSEGGDLVSRLKKVLKEDVSFDLCFFDEAHIGIIAESVRQQFQKTFDHFKMPIVLMSATYKKPATVLEDPRDLFVWDLQDIKDMKELPSLKLHGFIEKRPDVLQRYPGISQEILQKRIELGQTESDIAKPYLQFPSPNFISLTFTPDTIQQLKDMGAGYDYMSAFTIKSNPQLLQNQDEYMSWGSLLTNREQALRIRQFLTPEQDEKGEFLSDKERKYRAFNQIFSIAQKTGSRPMIGKPFSVLMFLPFGDGLPIGELCRIWGSFLLESRYWKNNFVVMTLSTYAGHVKHPKMTPQLAVERGMCHREDFAGSLKDTIQLIEREALKYGKGLVLLSGDVAKMGISLKCVDVVCLMSNNKDADDIIQKMYRALTDDPPYKKNGFIVDLNLTRIVQAMFEYDMEKSRRTISDKTIEPKERLNKLMELCNWGQDEFMIDHPDMTFDDVMNYIRNRVFSTIEERVQLQYGSRDLVDKQFKIIQDNPELLKTVVNVLQFTTGKRKKGMKENILERGKDIPEDEKDKNASEREVNVEEDEKPTPEVEALSIEQIKKKIVDIMITFVNALVIKSDQPWKGMNFQTLIDKYKADKSTATKVCSCEDSQVCNKTFSNLYDTAYCELTGYAMLESGKDDTGQSKVTYSPETHERIMMLMDTIFDKSGSLAPDWTNYINSLLGDISKQKTVIKGGNQRKTKRNKTRVLDKNVRITKRNNLGDD
jgi:hypothetical protein